MNVEELFLELQVLVAQNHGSLLVCDEWGDHEACSHAVVSYHNQTDKPYVGIKFGD